MADGSQHLSPEAAAIEVLRRRRARATLTDYSQSITIPGAPMSDDPDEWIFKPIETAVARHHIVTMRAIEKCIRTDYGRLMIFEPPGSAKSTYGSVVAPSWAMGAFPGVRVLMTSYAATPIIRHSKRCRQILASREYTSIWERDTRLVEGSSAADEFELTNGSGLFATGLLGAMTSVRCDVGIIDDPVAGREEAESETMRIKTLAAYEDDFLTRLKPKASIIIISCMVGDTRVLMADGTEKRMRELLVGDAIATYCDGAIAVSTVQNWVNHGPDSVYEIRMSSGITVRANERHPFLVDRGGNQSWVRLRDLVPGDIILRVIGGSGAESTVQPQGATSQQSAKVSACPTTTNSYGQADTGRHPSTQNHAGVYGSNIDTDSASPSTTNSIQSNEGCVPFAESHQERTCDRIGEASCASTTTTPPERSADCSATTVTSPLATAEPKKFFSTPLNTFEIIPDRIVEIVEAGREDVFDIQVAGTENFIANGLVSHNTRWHQDDLAGCILPEDYDGRSGPVLCRDGQTWEVLNIQAKCEMSDDPVGRKLGEYLWPEWFGPPHWAIFQRNKRTWSSLYQQRPVPDEGIHFKRENFRRYDGDDPPGLRYYLSSDFAVKEQKDKAKHGTPDFSEHGVFGVESVKIKDGEEEIEEVRVFISDWWGDQVETDESIDAALDLAQAAKKRGRPILLWFGELGVIEHAIGPQVRSRMRQRKVFVGRELLPSIEDKIARCAGFIGMVNSRCVYVKKGDWGDALIEQLCAFPGGRYKDKVDTCGLFARGLDLVVSGKRPRPTAQKSWRDKLRAKYGHSRSPMTS